MEGDIAPISDTTGINVFDITRLKYIFLAFYKRFLSLGWLQWRHVGVGKCDNERSPTALLYSYRSDYVLHFTSNATLT